ncbi:RNA polymerase sigma factor [Porphyromonas sp.]|uniref:RNA polymerase sigma factor n=1 Tax=Porphyromonas sp. TaxID=1924944 RepID=UPI0026DA731B|nr:sigma-70 family RNA polymerase sigma factor [Porphyromonas sp.]MDO4770605.1 sigma-70 family RNA polymerase sigma factor [Porphyromonas sp.]
MEQKRFIIEVAGLRPDLQRKALSMYDGDEMRAEDAVSELFVRLWQTRHTLDEVRSLPAYCHTLLRNLIIDDLRSARTQPLDESVTADRCDDTLGRYELSELLREAIGTLPELRKRVYELHELRGFDNEEIAQLLNLRIDAVHNHLSRARRQLREYLLPLM